LKKIALVTVFSLLISLFSLQFSEFSNKVEAAKLEIIVDNDDLTAFETDSKWGYGSAKSGFYGNSYQTDGKSTPDPGKWAKFTPDIPIEGNYKIYMWWPSAGARPNAAPVEIKHKNGIETGRILDQSKVAGKWEAIGVFELSKGKDNYFKIYADDDGYTVADAVKFELTSSAVTPLKEYKNYSEQVLIPDDNLVEVKKNAPPIIKTELAMNFPIYQTSINKVITGSNRGFGMLAKYTENSPKEIYISRTTKKLDNEPLKPAANVSIFDPEGKLVLFEDLSNQTDGQIEKVISVPKGPTGIWTVSISGGRDGDKLAIGVPETDIWGIRGEMALGITETTPQKAYFYLADITQQERGPMFLPSLQSGFFFLDALGVNSTIKLFNNKGELVSGLTDMGSRRVINVDKTPLKEVWSLEFGGVGGHIVFDGTPGLICPSKQAALELKGGTVEAEGFVMPGALQARLRNAMIEISKKPLGVELEFPDDIPQDIIKPQMEVLLYGKYGATQGVGYVLKHQVLDINNPYFGMVVNKDPKVVPKGQISTAAGGLATAAVTPGLMNPAYGNKAIMYRAVLNSMSLLAWMQGDFTYKDNDLRQSLSPSSNFFIFVGPFVVDPYIMLHDKIDPELAEVWKEAILAILRKYADMNGYLTNQWSHNILFQLSMYEKTGEKDLLQNFERMITSLFDGNFGIDSTFGQHPAGFFQELYGPEGGYDHLSAYHLMASYLIYKNLENKDPIILEKIKKGLEKNLYFKSFYWLPQPNGSIYSPTSINTRTDTPIWTGQYPGDIMGRAYFPLGLTRFLIQPQPSDNPKDLAGGETMPQRINNDAWALKTLNTLLPYKEDYSDLIREWAHTMYEAYSEKITVEPAKLPIEYEYGTWELPGQIAFKRAGLYGLIFYDVAGAKRTIPQAKLGGGPTALWSKGTGSVISSMRNTHKGVIKTAEDIVHSCVYGNDNRGNLFYTGEERTNLKWIEKDKIFELESELSKPKGKLVWRYVLEETEITIIVTLKLDDVINGAYVNLPILVSSTPAEIKKSSDKQMTFSYKDSEMDISWDTTETANILDTIKTAYCGIKNLQIPILGDGTPLKIKINSK
jgi:hypothetical protein